MHIRDISKSLKKKKKALGRKRALLRNLVRSSDTLLHVGKFQRMRPTRSGYEFYEKDMTKIRCLILLDFIFTILAQFVIETNLSIVGTVLRNIYRHAARMFHECKAYLRLIKVFSRT